MTNDPGLHDDFLDGMLGDFIDESEGLLSQLNENLFVLEDWVNALGPDHDETPDADLINEMFRAAHSLKGLSAMLRLDDINVLTHKMENVFDAARNNGLIVTPDAVDVIFQSVDKLGAMIEQLKGDHDEPIDSATVIDKIRILLEFNGVEKEMGTQAAAEDIMNDAVEAENSPTNDSSPRDATQAAAASMQTIQNGVEQLQDPPQQPAETTQAAVDHFAGVTDETDLPANYLSIFIDETEQSLDDLSDLLLNDKDEKTVESLMILCHRIKGSAASLALNRPAKLAHLMEDVLQELIQSKASLPDAVVDALLSCTDALRTYVETLKTGNPQSDGFAAAYQALVQARAVRDNSQSSDSAIQQDEPAAASDGSSQQPPSQTSPSGNFPQLSDEDVARVVLEASDGARGFVAQVVFEEDLPLVELKAQLVIERANSFGHLFHCVPAESTIEDHPNLRNLIIGVATAQPIEDVNSKLNLEGVARVDVAEFGEVSASIAEDAPAEAPSPAAAPSGNTSPKSEQKAPPAAKVEPKPATAAPAAATGQKDASDQRRSRPAETLRVDIDRLDQLMNLAGQLVINKARFVQISDGLRNLTQLKNLTHAVSESFNAMSRMSGDMGIARHESADCVAWDSIEASNRQLRENLDAVQHEVRRLSEMRGLVGDLAEAVHQLDRAADGIQKSVMDTRMVPIGPLFGRFKRVVRDLTRGTDKQVQLDIRGEKTELDKRMIDELGDPLIHMVRNSVDHGIESPSDRENAGKPACGIVKLDAFHRGNRIVIQITDDGKGLDPEKLRAKAIDRGVVAEADAERMTSQQIFQLIWEPGFSTAEKVTEVSGRGMGMDIVRSKIEELNGTVDLDSTPGKGTVFTIRLPLTMAILPTLLCRITGDVFAVPVESVMEIVRIRKAELSTIRGKPTTTVRGRVVSVVELADMFTWNRPAAESAAAIDSSEVTLVMIGIDNREVGLIVDDVIGEEDIVIKSMSENYRNVEGIAGASILGDGRVSLILDVGAVLDMACNARGVLAQVDANQSEETSPSEDDSEQECVDRPAVTSA